jgi:hypothetical protein
MSLIQDDINYDEIENMINKRKQDLTLKRIESLDAKTDRTEANEKKEKIEKKDKIEAKEDMKMEDDLYIGEYSKVLHDTIEEQSQITDFYDRELIREKYRQPKSKKDDVWELLDEIRNKEDENAVSIENVGNLIENNSSELADLSRDIRKLGKNMKFYEQVCASLNGKINALAEGQKVILELLYSLDSSGKLAPKTHQHD